MNSSFATSQLCEILSSIINIPVEPTDNLRDLGVESIATMRCIAVLNEKYDVSIPLTAAFDARTVEDLAAVVRTNQQRPGESAVPS